MKQHIRLQHIRERRAERSRARIRGTASVPRFAVFRSNRGVYVQLIDDERARTLVAAAAKEVDASREGMSKTECARLLGTLLAKKAREAGITKAVFDRRHYRYHGRVKAVAEGAREAGLLI